MTLINEFRAIMTFLSLFSRSFSLFISISYSLSLPNRAAVVKVVKSFDSVITVTFGCHNLSKLLNFFYVQFLLVKGFLKRMILLQQGQPMTTSPIDIRPNQRS